MPKLQSGRYCKSIIFGWNLAASVLPWKRAFQFDWEKWNRSVALRWDIWMTSLSWHVHCNHMSEVLQQGQDSLLYPYTEKGQKLHQNCKAWIILFYSVIAAFPKIQPSENITVSAKAWICKNLPFLQISHGVSHSPHPWRRTSLCNDKEDIRWIVIEGCNSAGLSWHFRSQSCGRQAPSQPKPETTQKGNGRNQYDAQVPAWSYHKIVGS